MNATLAIQNSSKGRIAAASFDFSSIGFQTGVLNKPYFNTGNTGSILYSANTASFPQGANTLNAVGLRYYYRPFYNYLGGDISAAQHIELDSPAAYVYNKSNGNTEVIGMTRTAFDSYYSVGGAAWVTNLKTLAIIGAAQFECEFQDVLDVTSILQSNSGPYGFLQIQLTEFDVTPFCKSVDMYYTTAQ